LNVETLEPEGNRMKLCFAIAQIAPVLLNRDATLAKVVASVRDAAQKNCQVVAFGETLVPGYPVWLSRTGGSRFECPDQQALHAHYLDQGVSLDAGHLAPVQQAARDGKIMVVLGIAERPAQRGGHTLYCTRVIIGESGDILSTHRKLMPTYEERLCWGIGDGAGLVTHPVGSFRLGSLNCWENWMPLARTALYAAGEDLHVAIWPGDARLTRDITRFVALEGRSYVVSAGALLRDEDIPQDLPLRADISRLGEVLYDGGSCVAGPDGDWLIEPRCGVEDLLVVELDPARIRAARQNFDPVGHYARPDVLRLQVNRGRQQIATDFDPPHEP
jgi:nitrilase